MRNNLFSYVALLCLLVGDNVFIPLQQRVQVQLLFLRLPHTCRHTRLPPPFPHGALRRGLRDALWIGQDHPVPDEGDFFDQAG